MLEIKGSVALDKAAQKEVAGSRRGCTSNCDCWYSHGGNESFGYVCSNGRCVLGIYPEPPCG